MKRKDIIIIALFIGSTIGIFGTAFVINYFFCIYHTQGIYVANSNTPLPFINLILMLAFLINIIIHIYSIISLAKIIFKKEENKEITNN